MKSPSFTLINKVAAGYLLIVLFSLVAIGYALTSLHRQTIRSEQLVNIDFKAVTLLRSLRQNLLAQERLAGQSLILKDQTFCNLLSWRAEEFSTQWRAFLALTPAPGTELRQRVDRYLKESSNCLPLLKESRWEDATARAQGYDNARNVLLAKLTDDISAWSEKINQSLSQLTETSQHAYRATWFLAFMGIILSAPAAFAVVFSIHRSIKALLQATREIAEGSFNYQIPIRQPDEFGHLAREFARMGQKLQEMKERSLDANPLTRLPGNQAIERELTTRIEGGVPFSQLYFDLDHFKVYNDRYGYQAGSEVISQVGDLIRTVVTILGNPDDLLGHIGGDDYVVLTSPDKAEAIAQTVIKDFDRLAPSFYSDEDAKTGHFVGKDRFGVERTFSLLTISIAIIDSEPLETPLASAIGRESARMKEHLKNLPGSNFLRNRRHRLT